MVRRQLIFISVLIVVATIMVVIVAITPYKIVINSIPSPWYADIVLTSDTMDVSINNMFGMSLDISDDDVSVDYTADGLVTVEYNNLVSQQDFDIIYPDTTNVSYIGTAYVGNSIIASDIIITAHYGDEVRDVDVMSVSADVLPLATSVDVQVQTCYDVLSLTVYPQQIVNIYAAYDKDLYTGDTFDIENVSVYVQYDDGVIDELESFTISESVGTVSSSQSVTVVTDYGTCSLSLNLEDEKVLEVECLTSFYVGDVLMLSDFNLYYVENGAQYDVDDFVISTVGVLQTDAEIVFTCEYGTVTEIIDVIDVETVAPVLQAPAVVSQDLDFTNFKVTYTDGTTALIARDSVNGLDDEILCYYGTQSFWFEYSGVYYYFEMTLTEIEVDETEDDSSDSDDIIIVIS